MHSIAATTPPAPSITTCVFGRRSRLHPTGTVRHALMYNYRYANQRKVLLSHLQVLSMPPGENSNTMSCILMRPEVSRSPTHVTWAAPCASSATGPPQVPSPPHQTSLLAPKQSLHSAFTMLLHVRALVWLAPVGPGVARTQHVHRCP